MEFAEDGLVALSKLDALDPDLIVLDMMMLNMDGLSFMQELARRERYFPILVLTAHQAAYDTAVKWLGADCCLMKPFDVDKLLARAEGVLMAAQLA